MKLPTPLLLSLLYRPGWQRHGFALAVLALAILAHKLLGPQLQDVAPLATGYVAVLLVTWFSGGRAATWVACAAYAAAFWPLHPTDGALTLSRASGVFASVLYAIASGLTIHVCESLRRARSRNVETEPKAASVPESQLEQEVARRTAELNATIAELEGFSYTLVHDMRAPLRSIRTFTAALGASDADTLSPEAAANLQRIDQTAARMDRLIVDILNFSRLTRQPVDVQAVDLDQVMRDVVVLQPAFSSGKADILIEGPLPRVRGNEALLSQCFSNLLQNATKFVAPGVKPRIRIDATRNGDHVLVNVQDNGIGVLPEATERIFEPFQREDPRFDGAGIGLAIVRKVIERLAGRVGVNSEPGRGSRFWVELPAVHPPGSRDDGSSVAGRSGLLTAGEKTANGGAIRE